MRLLLDENVPVRLVPELVGHTVVHVRDLRWQSLPDSELAIRATGDYDAILTLDQSFPSEVAGLEGHPAVIVLVSRSHRLTHVLELLPDILRTLPTVEPGQVVRLFRPPAVLT